jgi:hypothetical protein
LVLCERASSHRAPSIATGSMTRSKPWSRSRRPRPSAESYCATTARQRGMFTPEGKSQKVERRCPSECDQWRSILGGPGTIVWAGLTRTQRGETRSGPPEQLVGELISSAALRQEPIDPGGQQLERTRCRQSVRKAWRSGLLRGCHAMAVQPCSPASSPATCGPRQARAGSTRCSGRPIRPGPRLARRSRRSCRWPGPGADRTAPSSRCDAR